MPLTIHEYNKAIEEILAEHDHIVAHEEQYKLKSASVLFLEVKKILKHYLSTKEETPPIPEKL
jgi:hypothetical protein